jgi:hypothetical protein
LPYKKLTVNLTEMPVEETPPSKPIVETAQIIKIASQEENIPPLIAADISKPSDSVGRTWKKMLLDGDPISVTDLTKVFQEPTNTFSGQLAYNYTYTVAPAVAGQSFQASLLDVWNRGASAETVAFRFGATGPLRFMRTLNPNAGYIVNLIKTVWRGPTNTAFNIYTFEASPLVTYTVFGEYQP